MRQFKWCVMCLSIMAVLGCSAFDMFNKKVDYKTSSKLPPLEIPPDLARISADDRFAVPDTGGRGAAVYSEYSKTPGRLQTDKNSLLPSIDNVRVERAGNQRWLVVPGSPAQIWTVVKEFWQEAGFIVNVEVPEAGIMETDWNEMRSQIKEGGLRGLISFAVNNVTSSSERDKFRTRLEVGNQGTTEIYISHRRMEEEFASAAKDRLIWQPRPPNPELEVEMLRRLMVRFGVDAEGAKTKVAAVSIDPQAKLIRGTDSGLLSLVDPFDRAWRRVGLALDRVGFTVEDRDRSQGVYFVRYIDPDTDVKTTESTSWLAKLKFWDNSAKVQSKEQYKVVVREAANATEVRIYEKGGSVQKSETIDRILTLLLEQLK
jgi:outer membrane protein assembly factor BamC